MQKTLVSVLLAGAMMATPAFAQKRTAAKLNAPSRFSAAFTYSPARAKTVGGNSFWLHGGSGQFDYRFWRGLSAVADVGGLHNGDVNSSGVAVDMMTFTAGLRYTWTPAKNLKSPVSLYGQGLVGMARGFNGIYPGKYGAVSSANGLAALVGGGANLKLTPHIAVRIVEADWLRTDLPDSTTSTQNTLRISTGIAYQF